MQRRLYTYENFDVDLNGSSFLVVVLGLYAGILLGVLFSLIVRVNAHRVVKALSDAGATTRDDAKTLAQLGLAKNRAVRRMLATDGSMRKVVLCANESEFPERKLTGLQKFWREKILRDPLPPKTDFEIARFYLPEEKRITAEVRYAVEGHPVRNFILAAVGLTAAAVFTILALPELLAMFDNFVTQVRPQSKFY